MQTLKIKCQKCEKEETYMLDGCLILGINLDGTPRWIQHEINFPELAKTIGKFISYEDFIKAIHAGLHQYLGEGQ